MKQNGFTLIELIGVVAVLALIMVITIPQIMSTITNSNIKETESFARDLEMSAMTYVENEWNQFKIEYQNNNKSDNYCMSVSSLIEKNYIKKTEIDPSTNDVINADGKYILLTNISDNSGSYRFSYKYVDTNLDNTTICSSWNE